MFILPAARRLRLLLRITMFTNLETKSKNKGKVHLSVFLSVSVKAIKQD